MSDEDAFLASMTGAAQPDSATEQSAPLDTLAAAADGEYDPTAPNEPIPAAEEHGIPVLVEAATPAEGATALGGALPTAQRAASKSPNPSNLSKQVTIGGFVAEDSDEEETDVAQSGTLAVEKVKSPSQAPSGSVLVSSAAHSLLAAPANAASLSNGISNPVPSSSPAPASNGVSVDSQAVAAPASSAHQLQDPSAVVSLPKSRLPNDIVGQLEDRIAEDPKGDHDAWLALISHLKSKEKYEEVRRVYGRLFEVFPTAADQWVAYARMELELDDLPRLEAIFNLSLLKVQSIGLWSIYLDHVRRRNDIVTDATGQGRQVVTQAYEFVMNQVGQDKDSGQLWQDYIAFIKTGPGNPGGTSWQDAQKMDLLRKAYQRAVCIPMSAVSGLWKEYDTFEMGLNKMTGRKFLQEKSPSYMTARSSFTELQNITRLLKRGALPRLPPHHGFDGEDDFADQVEGWQKWIKWEKDDPLVLKDEDAGALQNRILFVYRQATMSLRFYPRIWYEAAQWCSDVGLNDDAQSFLDQGLEANAESCLLAFKKADRVEAATPAGEDDDTLISRGKAVRAPYDIVLDALYKHIDKVTSQEKMHLSLIEQRYATMAPDDREGSQEPAVAAGEAMDEDSNKPPTQRILKQREIDMRKSITAAEVKLTSKTLTYAWIALMRAMRRVQRQGKPGEAIGGMRGIFREARVRGRLMSDFHIASALMEHHCYKDPAASKIFNLGMRLFPEDENFALEHVKFLISTGDLTNARAVFETTVSKITANPQNVFKARILFAFFHDWESKYGELSQASKIEARMAELYPDENRVELFSQRFGSATIGPAPFDPCDVELALSLTQTRPKGIMSVMPTIETTEAPPPPLPMMGYIQSPKRALDDSEAELPARKLIRGDSPLKGAAGRRQQQRQAREGLLPYAPVVPAGPKPLPQAVQSLLAIIPPARQWDQTRFEPSKMVDLIRQVDMTRARLPGNNAGQPYGH